MSGAGEQTQQLTGRGGLLERGGKGKGAAVGHPEREKGNEGRDRSNGI